MDLANRRHSLVAGISEGIFANNLCLLFSKCSSVELKRLTSVSSCFQCSTKYIFQNSEYLTLDLYTISKITEKIKARSIPMGKNQQFVF